MLQSGDRVGIVATAGKVKTGSLDQGIKLLQQWGFQVICGPNLFQGHGYFAGTDAQRAADLQMMLDDPSIKAIFCARGGYGTTRMIDSIDFTHFQQQPKWLIGFSDVTTLHQHIHRLGIQSIHGQTVSALSESQASSSIKKVLLGGAYSIESPAHQANRLGQAEGVLVGGNLSLLCNLIGTASAIDTRGKILFIEEVSEPLYHFDRMLVQLARAGKLSELSGLIIGELSSMTNPENKFTLTAEEIVLEKVANFNYPVCFDFPVGHIKNNWAMPCGRWSVLDVNTKHVSLRFDVGEGTS